MVIKLESWKLNSNFISFKNCTIFKIYTTLSYLKLNINKLFFSCSIKILTFSKYEALYLIFVSFKEKS